MAAPRRAPAIDLGDIGRGIGSVANDVLMGPIARTAKSVGKVNKRAGGIANEASDWITGFRGDRNLKQNLRGGADTLLANAIFVGLGKGVKAVRGARKATKIGKAAKAVRVPVAQKARSKALAQTRARATGRKIMATDSKYEKVYGYKAVTKKAPVKKVAAKKAPAKKKGTVLR